MSDESLVALGQKFQQLRGRPGKYSGGEYDEAIDSPEGEKFKVMKVCQSGNEVTELGLNIGKLGIG